MNSSDSFLKPRVGAVGVLLGERQRVNGGDGNLGRWDSPEQVVVRVQTNQRAAEGHQLRAQGRT